MKNNGSTVKINRLMIAGTNSGCGKTTITCALLYAMKKMGLSAASFKCGPDYIDPMFHSRVLGVPSGNLDLFFSDEGLVNYLLAGSADKDITVIEGVMGFYDGMDFGDTRASSYELSKITDTPVILVCNCRGMAYSAVAMIRGFTEHRKDNTIKGVILNGVSKMTATGLKEAIERELDIKVFGFMPQMEDVALESRHLGLVTPCELGDIQKKLELLAQKALECIDINALIECAGYAPEISAPIPRELGIRLENKKNINDTKNTNNIKNNKNSKNRNKRIGIAFDRAFCFYYSDNIRLLEQLGYEIIYFSPLEDKELPQNIDALLLGGGYPEEYAQALANNMGMKEQILSAVESGMPVLAECGGFMYLHEYIRGDDGTLYPMVGAIRGKVWNEKKLVRFGYISISPCVENRFLKSGESIRGHEFHYYESDNNGAAFKAVKPSGKREWSLGHIYKNLVAGFAHLYFYSNIDFVVRLLEGNND